MITQEMTGQEVLQELVATLARNLRARGEFEIETADLVHHIRHVLWYAGRCKGGVEPGSFTSQLLQLFQAADRDNFMRLCHGFPVMGYLVQQARKPGGLEILQRAVNAA